MMDFMEEERIKDCIQEVKAVFKTDPRLAFEKLQGLNLENPHVATTTANALLQMGKIEESITVLQDVPLKKCNSDQKEIILSTLASHLNRIGRYFESIAVVRVAIKNKESNDTLRFTLVSSLLVLGNFQEAEKEARVALGIYPQSDRILLLLAETLRRQGRFEDALKEVKKSRNWTPTKTLIKIYCFIERGIYISALRELRLLKFRCRQDQIIKELKFETQTRVYTYVILLYCRILDDIHSGKKEGLNVDADFPKEVKFAAQRLNRAEERDFRNLDLYYAREAKNALRLAKNSGLI